MFLVLEFRMMLRFIMICGIHESMNYGFMSMGLVALPLRTYENGGDEVTQKMTAGHIIYVL
jgi:hypothetical protein